MTFGNVLIFGDSYSTFKGFVPEGYAVYYTTERKAGPNITDVNDTWWYPLIKETNSALIRNDSWSGSTICYTGYNGTDCSVTSSFIARLEKLYAEEFFKKNRIDTVFIFGATNDSWADSPIGSIKYSDFSKNDLYSVLFAISYFVSRLREILPDARIVFIINTELKEVISEGIFTICNTYGIKSVHLENIDKDCGHPTVLGMSQIKKQILDSLS